MAAHPGALPQTDATEAPRRAGTELTSTASVVGPAEAERIALEHYGMAGRAEWLWGEKDSNYRLTLADGTERLLKILSPAEAPDVTRMHSRALLHLEAADPGIPVQRIVPALDGAPDLRAAVEAGGERAVRMVTFLDGAAQRGGPRSPGQRRQIGRLMARMEIALADFSDPAMIHPIAWDMTHALDLRDRLEVVEDPARRERLARILDDHAALILPRLAELPTQAIHNDFNPNNILVDHAAPERVTGIIDFGDLVRAPVLFDVAVGANYQMESLPDVAAAACDFLGGYAEHRTLTDPELALLVPAIMTRMVLRVVIPEWRASLFPEHRERYRAGIPMAYEQLDRLDALRPQDLAERFASVFAGDRP